MTKFIAIDALNVDSNGEWDGKYSAAHYKSTDPSLSLLSQEVSQIFNGKVSLSQRLPDAKFNFKLAPSLDVLESTDDLKLTLMSQTNGEFSMLVYFFYPTGQPPQSHTDIEWVYIAFFATPFMETGDTINIKYIDPTGDNVVADPDGSSIYFYTGAMGDNLTLPAGMSIGFAILDHEIVYQFDPDAENLGHFTIPNQMNATVNVGEDNWDPARRTRAICLRSDQLGGSWIYGIESGATDLGDNNDEFDFNDHVFVLHGSAVQKSKVTSTSEVPPSSLAAAWHRSGTIACEDMYDEHGSEIYGDYNDLVVRYFVTPKLNSDGSKVESILITCVAIANHSDDSHGFAVGLPGIRYMGYHAVLETFVSQSSSRTTQVVTCDESDRFWLTENDKELHIDGSQNPAYLRLRIVFSEGIDVEFFDYSHLPFYLRNNTTSTTFKSDELYVPEEGAQPKMQIIRIRNNVAFQPPKENGKMIEAYPQSGTFLQNVGSTTTHWLASRSDAYVMELANIEDDWDHSNHPYFDTFSDLVIVPTELTADQTVRTFDNASTAITLQITFKENVTTDEYPNLPNGVLTYPKRQGSNYTAAFFYDTQPTVGVFWNDTDQQFEFKYHADAEPIVLEALGTNPLRPVMSTTETTDLYVTTTRSFAAVSGFLPIELTMDDSNATWTGIYTGRIGRALLRKRVVPRLNQVYYHHAATGRSILWDERALKWTFVQGLPEVLGESETDPNTVPDMLSESYIQSIENTVNLEGDYDAVSDPKATVDTL